MQGFILALALFTVITVVDVQGAKEIAFYQKAVCSGHHYSIPLGRGECKRVPDWLNEEGWNLSVDPQGHCIKIYENPNCRESIAPAVASYGFSTRDDVIRRCKSTRQLVDTVRSFRKVQC